MDEDKVCRKCGLPIENGAEFCVVCERESSPRTGLGSRVRSRLSRARMFSTAKTGVQSSGSSLEEIDTHGESEPKGECNESGDGQVLDDGHEASECVEETPLEEEVRVGQLDAILTEYAAEEMGDSDSEEEFNERLPLHIEKETVCIRRPTARIKSYIEGFDEALGGGIPKGSVVLISGTAGAMKSSLAYYVLYMNVLARGLKCLYITLEQTINSLLNQMDALGMKLESVAGSISMFDVGFLRKENKESEKDWFELFMKNISNTQRRREIDLLVIDSLEALEVIAAFKDRREELFRLFEWLRDLDATTFIVTERPDCPLGKHLSHFRNEEEFLSDGIINLALHSIGEIDIQRRIRCIKMRGTKHEAGYLSLMWDDGKFKVTKAVGR